MSNNWFIVSEENSDIVVGFSFSEMGKDAPEYITYNGNRYKRDLLEPIPEALMNRVCSCRRYVKEKRVPLIEPRMGYGSGGQMVYI